MKIIFDTDGTLTKHEKYINLYVIDYIIKKYNMTLVYPEKLEIEDMFDMDNFFMNKYNCDLDTAKKYTKKVINDIAISLKFIKFSITERFRTGATDFINKIIDNGNEVEVHTTRPHTSKNNVLGSITRNLTILQYLLNDIKLPKEKFHFYKDEQAKIDGILASHPDIVFEDKPEIIEVLSQNGIKCFCLDGPHNKEMATSENVERIKDFTDNLTIEELKVNKR